MKKINFIPGLGEKPRDYKTLSKYFNIVNIDWNNGKTKLGKIDTLIGFSLGGIVAMMHAEKSKVKTLILCSIPPIDNLKGVKADMIIFLVGSKEIFATKHMKRVYKNYKGLKKFIIIKGADHKIGSTYSKAILDLTKGG